MTTEQPNATQRSFVLGSGGAASDHYMAGPRLTGALDHETGAWPVPGPGLSLVHK
jgi:hypothetical protein